MTTSSRPAARPVDWNAVRRRMAAAIEQTEALLEAAQQDAQYERRSARSAGDALATQSEEQAIGLVTFMLSDRQFALEIRYVCEIVAKARFSPLPAMPPHACGVYDLRGQLLPVFDLCGLLDLPRGTGTANDWAIVCGQTQPEFLILSDAVPEISTLPLEEIEAVEPDPGDNTWHCATTKAGTVILDGDLLLNDRQFFLEDEQIIASDDERTEIHEPPISK
ncbi:chemotaxis protein CheW [Sinorhizobium garamanticum]|uniref:Chemotaxis protein CheW n=1 Tax=Sinorhizobium garamanticum TaxID=680247 RepID=A0ABY8DIM8_9HYPH|nr:chemotaxis protein CheW [Sinorhizobium garamanticum]WEX90770.1 chemotaxis protein CheW [Sinorhizobium garamanticum]